MKLLALVLLLCPLPLAAQSDAASPLPTDPNQLLTIAAQFYDYASPDMKPWHVRYHYQSFDQSGQPLGEGDFDYWWSTTKVTKISWTNGDQSHIEWHTADGKELRSVTGKDIGGLDHRLSSALIPGFLKINDQKPRDRPLVYFITLVSSQPVACVGASRSSTVQVRPSTVSGESALGITPSNADKKIDTLDAASPGYCFDQHAPVLIASHENGTITTFYGQNRKFQNHNFADQITISYVGAKRVVATLKDLTEVPADDPSFTPSPDAKEYVSQMTRTVSPLIQIPTLTLIKRVDPVYPPSARAAHVEGTVVVQATIAKDGTMKDAKVISSPSDALSEAALDAVRQWLYKPNIVNGQPTEIHTKISVTFHP